MITYAPMIHNCHEWFAWMDARMMLTFDYPSFSEGIELNDETAGFTMLFE